MKNIFNISGKMDRIDYFGYSFLLGLISFIVGALIFYVNNLFSVFVLLLICIFVIIFAINITVKRLHDLGRPGTHCLLLLIPVYNIYFSIILLFKKGTTE
jgi:uncharacterized membrane protein YhaH (DUF805 family)